MTEILESNLIIENPNTPKFGRMQSLGAKIYESILQEATNIPSRVICSLCAKTFGSQNKLETMGMRTHFHGSEFGKCFRQVQLNLIHHSKNLDGQKKIFYEDGHLHEEIYSKLLERNYSISKRDEETIVKRNVQIPELDRYEQVEITTHNDLLLKYDTYKFVLEFKAVKDWFTKNRYMKKIIPNAYYGQCQIYMLAADTNYALLFFKNRGSSEIYPPFLIERNDDYINQRFHYLAMVKYFMGSNKRISHMVPKEYQNKKCDACKFCDYYNTCWS